MNGASAAQVKYVKETSEPKENPFYVISNEQQYCQNIPYSTARENQLASTEWVEESQKVCMIPDVTVLRKRYAFQLLQLWEGKVIRVGKDNFTAILMDKSNPSKPEEEVIIDLQEVSEDDLPLLRPGAILYWSIGYEEDLGRPRQRVSRIRLRRLPGWTKRELDEAKRKAAKLSDLFL